MHAWALNHIYVFYYTKKNISNTLLFLSIFCFHLQPDKTWIYHHLCLCYCQGHSGWRGGRVPGRQHHSLRQEVAIRESEAIIKHRSLAENRQSVTKEKKKKHNHSEEFDKNTSEVKPLIIRGERDIGRLCGWEIERKKQITDREGEVDRQQRQKAEWRRWRCAAWW